MCVDEAWGILTQSGMVTPSNKPALSHVPQDCVQRSVGLWSVPLFPLSSETGSDVLFPGRCRHFHRSLRGFDPVIRDALCAPEQSSENPG